MIVIVFFDVHVLPEVPPVLVVFSLSRVPTEHAPSPLVNQITKRKESDLSESHGHQEIQVTLCKTTRLTNKTKRFEPIEISQFLGRFWWVFFFKKDRKFRSGLNQVLHFITLLWPCHLKGSHKWKKYDYLYHCWLCPVDLFVSDEPGLTPTELSGHQWLHGKLKKTTHQCTEKSEKSK